MKQEYIVFNGHSSKEFGLYISSDFKIKSAKNDIQVVEIMGRDGAVLIPNKRLLPVDQSIPFFIKLKTSDRRSLTDVAQEISAWLHTSTWTELKLSWDPLYTYRAIMLEDFEIEETLRKFGKLSITFKLHPVKYLESGKLLSTVSNGETIVNPTTLPSKPYFELRGTGNVTVRIGEESMSFKNVSTGINVDCEKCSAWFGQTAAYDQLVTDNFLKIQPGINTIRLDNSSFILRLRPNWGAKV